MRRIIYISILSLSLIAGRWNVRTAFAFSSDDQIAGKQLVIKEQADSVSTAIAYNPHKNEYLDVFVYTPADCSFKSEMRGQRIDATTGNKIGDDFLILSSNTNCPTSNYKFIDISIVFNPENQEYLLGYIVVENGSGKVRGLRLSETGSPVTSNQIEIASDLFSPFRNTSVAYDTDNDQYLIGYHKYSASASEFYTRFIDRSSETVSGSVVVNKSDFASTCSGVENSTLVMDEANDKAIVVTQANFDSASEIWGIKINPTTQSKSGVSFQISPTASLAIGSYNNPSATISPESQELFVVYENINNSGTNYALSNYVYGQAINLSSNSKILTNQLQINSIPAAGCTICAEDQVKKPKVGYNSIQNEYFVIYFGIKPAGGSDPYNIYGSRVNAADHALIDLKSLLIAQEIGTSVDHNLNLYGLALAYNSTNNQFLAGWIDHATKNVETQIRKLVNNAPTAISVSNLAINENQIAGTFIGSLNTTDYDPGDIFTYSLADTTATGNYGEYFTISGNELNSGRRFNYEQLASMKIKVRSTDSGGDHVDQSFTVKVNDINDQPSNITLTKADIDENMLAGTVIGALSAVDEDAGDTYSFEIASGGDNFDISGTNLISKAPFDHEQNPQLTVGIKVTDNHGASSTENLSITVNDVNEPPVGISLESGFDENVPPQDLSTNIVADDPDVDDIHTFNLVQGEGDTDNALFTVVGDDQLMPSIPFNYEEKSTYQIRLKVTDNANNTLESPVLVQINDVNETPDSVYIDTPVVEAGLDPGSEIGRLFTVDPDNDAGDTHNYYEVSQTYDVRVDLEGNVIANKTFKFNATDTTQNVVVFDVKSVDSGDLFKEQQITVKIIKPIDREPPELISNSLAFYEYYPDTLKQKALDIQVGDNEGIDTVILHYKGIGQADWNQKGFELTGSSGGQLNRLKYTTTITPSIFDAMGLMYYLEIKDINKNVNLTDTSYIYRIRLNQSLKSLEGSTFNGSSTSYKIISIPVDLVTNIRNILEDPENLGPWDPDQWRLLYWDAGDRGYEEFPKSFNTLSRGAGYWFNAKNSPVKVNLGTVKSPKYTHDNLCSISLKKSWNEIGNPYPFDINWNDVAAANSLKGQAGKIYLFEDGRFVQDSIIPAYGGGFVFTDNAESVRIPLVDAGSHSGARIAKNNLKNSLDADNWMVNLQLSAGNSHYNLGGFGMKEDADNSEDQYDEMLLPRIGQAFDYYFSHKEFFYPYFSRDIVQSAKNYVWSFTVDQDIRGAETSLGWDNSYFGNSSMHLVLYDVASGVATEMTEKNTYSFHASGENEFKVFYGEETFIKMALKNIQIAFGAPYPNPFNEDLTFPVSLPLSEETYSARLKIFNMMGQNIFDADIDNLGTGSEQLVWKGKNATGHETAKGIYLYELTVINKKQTFKQQGRILKE